MDGVHREFDAGGGRGLPAGEVRSAAAAGGVVAVTFDRTVEFHPDWLRDNCPCPTCRILQTDERRHQPWRQAGPSVPATVAADEGALVVDWDDGHRSRFEPAHWARLDAAMRRGAHTVRLWRRGYEPERFDHDELLADPPTRRAFYEAFRRDGVAVVTGSPTAPGSIVTTCRALGITLVDSSLGFIFDVVVDPAGYNIAYTAEAVPPHNDNAQYATPPSGQVLAMLVNEATGGESSVIDGFCVLDQLAAADPGALEVLARVEVGFRQYSHDADAFTRAPLVRRDAAGRFTHLRFSNQLLQPLPFDHPDLGAWYRAYRALGELVTDPANAVSFRLRGGDSLFVANHRVLHARAAFSPDGARHLQDVYFQADDIAGNLARLTGEATDAMVQP